MENPFIDKNILWVVHIGNDDRIALRARDEGFVCIGWTSMGDLSQYDKRDKMRTAMEQAFPDSKKGSISASYGQTFRFAHEMKEGDPIVLPVRPTREIAIGKITGEYKFAVDDADLFENDYYNIRPVEWLKIVPRTVFSQVALHSFGAFTSVSTSNDHLDEVNAVLTDSTPDPGVTDDEDSEESKDQSNLHETAVQETEDYLLKAWQGTGHEFEHVVAAVFQAMGFTARVTRATGDHGVDVIAHPDALGLEKPYIKIQTKSGTGTTGEPDVNQLKGTLNAGDKGILVSLGGFTKGAWDNERTSTNLVLIDGKKFVELFLDHYEKLEPSWQGRYPLRRVLVPLK